MSARALSLTRDELMKEVDLAVATARLRELDRALLHFLAAEAPGAQPLALLAAVLASHELGQGHACIDLGRVLALAHDTGPGPTRTPLPLDVDLRDLDLHRWRAALDDPDLVGSGAGDTPLVCQGPRVYLRRYWQYECEVRNALQQRIDPALAAVPVPPAQALREALDVLFPTPDATGQVTPNWQKLACALAARSAFSIITGGPGTGKTTTVVRLLALLQHLALHPDAGSTGRALRIRLAAPTGKAAARLNESIAGAVRALPLDALPQSQGLREHIPTEVTTLHRLLGSRPDSRRFRHDAWHPLALDVLVIDEASMIDLEMMASVLAALPRSARLVLLGDRDQLASVEAGAVLGELCARARAGHYTPATGEWLAQAAGEVPPPELVDPHGQALDQVVTMLRHSHRFGAHSGIGQLAEAVNSGQVAALRAVWQAGHSDIARLDLSENGSANGSDPAASASPWHSLVVDGAGGTGGTEGPSGYRHYLECLARLQPAADADSDPGDDTVWDQWARDVLQAFGQFQVLCAVRNGPWGVEGLNDRIARLLRRDGLIPATQGWYPGRPVLVTRNDYGLGLMNGDVGITLARPVAGSKADGGARIALRVAFAAGDGSQAIKWVLPSRLQAVETVYAMTVHKSQGSEFAHAALILPEELNPVLTRELVYTGITRARRWFTLAEAAPDARVLERAITRRVQRASGLLDGLLDGHTGGTG